MALTERGKGRKDYSQVVSRLGTIGHLGTVSYIGTCHTGTVPVIRQGLGFRSIVMRDRVPLGPGSVWAGSWQHIGSFRQKTFFTKSVGASGSWGGGSFSILSGLSSTGADGLVGTLYGYVRVGTYYVKSFEDNVRFARPIFKRTGGGRGTVSVGFSKQA